MSKKIISPEEISAFLEGSDPQKYIVAIEAPYHVSKVDLIINDPEQGKYIQTKSYKPFLWMKEEVVEIIYGGNRKEIKAAAKEAGVKFKALRTTNDDDFEPARLTKGYKFLAETTLSYSQLINFFRKGGVDIYDEKYRHLFMAITPVEQFMIQTGKRLFKGFDDYNDLHKFQFDLETEGLDPKSQAIFQIGMRDNRGFEEIITITGEDENGNFSQELKDKNELEAISNFFKVIDIIKPDIINGYNSENFDWNYFEVRCEQLGANLKDLVITLDNEKGKFKRKESRIKLGGLTENYKQAHMWGYSILDIWHAVRKAKAINSEIKSTGLKYITKYSRVSKPNRVYVQGDMLHKTWSDKTNLFYLNDTDGEWFKVDLENPMVGEALLEQKEKINSGKFEKTTGKYIVERYLKDDLWETDMIDNIYNQATFLVSKILPTTFMKAATMGTAGTWKLIMMSWSYENGLALPSLEAKRDFTGGLARLTEVGFAENVAKLDYAALYPNIELTHDIFPDLDITGVMKGLLFYIVDQRDTYKFLKNDHGVEADKYKKLLEEDPDNEEYKAEYKKHSKLKSDYDKKQLPLKILANSFFGSFGASYLFNWGDMDSAEETTCRGRQYLRLMVRHFHEKYGFRPLVGDTDGFNFAIPDTVEEITFTPTGNHRLTEEFKGVELRGLKAVVADFNEEYMIGRMGLDIDDVCETTINFSRKNYGNLINGKVKLVGNTIKSSKLPGYIEDFLNKGVNLLLANKGKDFVELYYETVDNIFNYRIPLAKMASKAKVNQTLEEYEKYCLGRNKAGNLNSRKAFMELIKNHGMKPSLGDIVYYVNTGTTKSHGDLKAIKDDDGNIVEIEMGCKLIPTAQLESNPNLTTDEYNVAKYLAALNKRIKPLLVCFNEEIRNSITIDSKKNRKTKEIELTKRKAFTAEECLLVSGKPLKDGDQDTYEDLMIMEDKEIRFWTSVNKVPNNIDLDEWEEIKTDYFKRLEQVELDLLEKEKSELITVFKSLKPAAYELIFSKNIIPPKVLKYVDLKPIYEGDKLSKISLVSHQLGVELFVLDEMMEYEPYVIYKEKFISGLPEKEKDVKLVDAAFDAHMNDITFTHGKDKLPELINECRVRGSLVEVKEEVVEEKQELQPCTEYDESDVVDNILKSTYNEDEDDEVFNF